MPLVTPIDDSASIGTTEYSLPADTTVGVPTSQTDDCLLQVWIDFGNMVAGDQYRWRVYERVNGGAATQRVVMEGVLTGAQPHPVVTPLLYVAHGWEATVLQLAGAAARTIGWSLRKVT